MTDAQFEAYVTKLIKNTVGIVKVEFVCGSCFVSHLSQNKAKILNDVLISDIGEDIVQMHCIVPGGQYVFDFV